jgi:hypothetical protein
MKQAITDGESVDTRRLWRIDDQKTAYCGLAILVTYAICASLLRAASKPFWYDEVTTWALAHQPNLAALWTALRSGADGHPPGFYIVENVFGRLLSNQEIALRIPSILGLCSVMLCVFTIVKKRNGYLIALGCAAMPLITVLYQVFTVEARPYLLLTACTAIAMVCYQHAPSKPWLAMMGIALALALTFHYYAVFVLVPFGLAELAFVLRTRQIRFGVWFAVIFAVTPLLLFWPLLSQLHEIYSQHPGFKPVFSGTLDIYGHLLKASRSLASAIVATEAVILLSMLLKKFRDHSITTPDTPDTPDTNDTPAEEYVLITSLIALPFFIFIGATIAHGGMTSRYALPASLGIFVGAGHVIERMGRRWVNYFLIFMLFSVLLSDAEFWMSQRRNPGRLVSLADSVEAMVASSGRSDLPVVLSYTIDYVPVGYYASLSWRKRLLTINDTSAELSYCGGDSIGKQLTVLRNYAPIQVEEFSTFASEHRDFLLYSDFTGKCDWLPSRLIQRGDSMTIVAAKGAQMLYLVHSRQ